MFFGSIAVTLDNSWVCDEIFAAIGLSVVAGGGVVVLDVAEVFDVFDVSDVSDVDVDGAFVVFGELGDDVGFVVVVCVVCGLPCVCTPLDVVACELGGAVGCELDAAAGDASDAATVTPSV